MKSTTKIIRILLFLFCLTFAKIGVSDSTAQTPSKKKYTLKANRITTPPKLDGLLEEKIWQETLPATNFIQKQPDEGKPATENTEIRILYDDQNLYLGIMCFDSEPDKIIANEKRRDSENIKENDHIQIMFDTFHDRRNGFIFITNPLGARLDLQIRKEGKREGSVRIANPNVNTDWNGVWDVKSAIISNGWSVEITIPLFCLRFNKQSKEGWGINFLRNIRRKNEESTWAPLPRSLNFYKISLAGVLTGLEGMNKGLKLQLKPYTLANRVYEKNEAGELQAENKLDGGLDVKYGLTSNITADVTVNTDFSQVEVDDQQINLTRFNLYYPEKREFFLENAAIFSTGTPEDAMIFFSRRIGLSASGEEIPLLGGAKIAGKAGRYNLGLINLQTKAKGDVPSNNFTVVRLSRDILGQSALGVMATNRQSTNSGDYNRAFCLDSDFILGQNLSLGGYLAMTSTPGQNDNNMAGKLGFIWTSNLWDIYGYYFDIQDNFNAEMGFVKRTGIRRGNVHVGYTPEPNLPGVRRLNPHGFYAYTTDQANNLLLREAHVHFSVDFINGGNVGFQWNSNYEFLDIPFSIQENIVIPVDIYSNKSWKADFRTDKSRNFYTHVSYIWGSFYKGNSEIWDIKGTFRPFSNLCSEFSFVYNDINLPQGAFTNHLLRTNLIYSFSTRLFLMSLIQWNTDTEDVSINVRLHYIYRPGSDFYLVYNDRRLVEGIETGIQDRTIALKFNYLFNL